MKKLLLALCLVLSLALPVKAETIVIKDLLDKFPLKQGVAFSIPDGEWRPMSSFSIIKKAGFSGDVGYVGEDKLVAGIFYELGRFEKFAEVPLLQYVDLEIGAYYGFEGINQMHSGEDYGVSIKVLEIKF